METGQLHASVEPTPSFPAQSSTRTGGVGQPRMSPAVDDSTFEVLDTSAEEVRTLLGSQSTGRKARRRLLWGFYGYSIASEVSRKNEPARSELSDF